MKKITIIDDSKETLKKFEESLAQDVKIQFQCITSPPFFDKRIERAILEFKPDLIILGLYLLNDIESGFEVLRQLKKSTELKNIPVVVISKYIVNSHDKYALKAKKLGAVVAIPKIPFPNVEKLISIQTG